MSTVACIILLFIYCSLQTLRPWQQCHYPSHFQKYEHCGYSKILNSHTRGLLHFLIICLWCEVMPAAPNSKLISPRYEVMSKWRLLGKMSIITCWQAFFPVVIYTHTHAPFSLSELNVLILTKLVLSFSTMPFNIFRVQPNTFPSTWKERLDSFL